MSKHQNHATGTKENPRIISTAPHSHDFKSGEWVMLEVSFEATNSDEHPHGRMARVHTIDGEHIPIFVGGGWVPPVTLDGVGTPTKGEVMGSSNGPYLVGYPPGDVISREWNASLAERKETLPFFKRTDKKGGESVLAIDPLTGKSVYLDQRSRKQPSVNDDGPFSRNEDGEFVNRHGKVVNPIQALVKITNRGKFYRAMVITPDASKATWGSSTSQATTSASETEVLLPPTNTPVSVFSFLGINRNASVKEVREAAKTKRQQYHTDPKGLQKGDPGYELFTRYFELATEAEEKALRIVELRKTQKRFAAETAAPTPQKKKRKVFFGGKQQDSWAVLGTSWNASERSIHKAYQERVAEVKADEPEDMDARLAALTQARNIMLEKHLTQA